MKTYKKLDNKPLVKIVDWNDSQITNSTNMFKPGTPLSPNKDAHSSQVTLQNIIKIDADIYFVIQFSNYEVLEKHQNSSLILVIQTLNILLSLPSIINKNKKS